MVAVKSDVEDCHQPYSDEGEGASHGEEGDENAGTFQIIISVHSFVLHTYRLASDYLGLIT